MAGDAAPTARLAGSDAASFAAVYRPLLGLWAVSGSPVAVQQLPGVVSALRALATAICQRGRLHPLLGNTLVRLMSVA